MRVVATDEYGRHILQGLLQVDMNEKKIRMAMISMMKMTRMTMILMTILMAKCVGSKTGRRG